MVLGMLVWLLATAGDSARLVVRADTTTVSVGDPVDIAVRLRLPAGVTLVDHVPRMRDTLPEGVRVLRTDTLVAGDGGWVGGMRIVSFRPDTQTVPPLVVAYRTADGATDSVVGPAVSIFVRPMLPDGNATLRDIKEIETPAVPWRAIVWGAVVCVVALVAGGGVVAARRRRLRAATEAAARAARERPPGPYELALARLAQLERGGGDIARHYAETADVVRRYLEETHGVPALERTTPEVVAAVAGLNGTAPVLGALLRDADLVKFARVRPDQPTAATFIGRAREVLRRLAETRAAGGDR